MITETCLSPPVGLEVIAQFDGTDSDPLQTPLARLFRSPLGSHSTPLFETH